MTSLTVISRDGDLVAVPNLADHSITYQNFLSYVREAGTSPSQARLGTGTSPSQARAKAPEEWSVPLSTAEVRAYAKYLSGQDLADEEVPDMLRAADYFEDRTSAKEVVENLADSNLKLAVSEDVLDAMPFEVYLDIIKPLTSVPLIDLNRASVFLFPDHASVFVSRVFHRVLRCRMEQPIEPEIEYKSKLYSDNHRVEAVKLGKEPVYYEIDTVDPETGGIKTWFHQLKDNEYFCFAEEQTEPEALIQRLRAAGAEEKSRRKHFMSARLARALFTGTPYWLDDKGAFKRRLGRGVDVYMNRNRKYMDIHLDVDVAEDVLTRRQLKAIQAETTAHVIEDSQPQALDSLLLGGLTINPLGEVIQYDFLGKAKLTGTLIYRDGEYEVFGTETGGGQFWRAGVNGGRTFTYNCGRLCLGLTAGLVANYDLPGQHIKLKSISAKTGDKKHVSITVPDNFLDISRREEYQIHVGYFSIILRTEGFAVVISIEPCLGLLEDDDVDAAECPVWYLNEADIVQNGLDAHHWPLLPHDYWPAELVL